MFGVHRHLTNSRQPVLYSKSLDLNKSPFLICNAWEDGVRGIAQRVLSYQIGFPNLEFTTVNELMAHFTSSPRWAE